MRRYITHIAAVLCCMAAAMTTASCSDDDKNDSRLEIISSDVTFEACGGHGMIMLSTTPDAVSSSADWCRVATAGTTISVSADRLLDLEARCAVITVTAAGRTIHVPVHQQGAVWDMPTAEEYTVDTDEATTLLLPMRIDFDYQVTSSAPEWLTGTMTSEGYLLSIPVNDSGARRRGTITFTDGADRSQTYTITQFGLRVIEGRYSATFGTSPDDLSDVTTRDVTIRLTDPEKLQFGIYGLCDNPDICAVMTYNARSHNLTFSPGQQYPGGETLLDGQTAYGYCALEGIYNNNGNIMQTYTPNASQDYLFTMDEQTGKPSFAFTDNGSWSGFTQLGFRIDLMPDRYPSDYNKLATLTHVIRLSLTKI